MKKFIVSQGNMTAEGAGDFWKVGTFDKLEDAKEKFELIKTDTKDITKYPGGYLETTIDLYENDEPIEILNTYIYEY